MEENITLKFTDNANQNEDAKSIENNTKVNSENNLQSSSSLIKGTEKNLLLTPVKNGSIKAIK